MYKMIAMALTVLMGAVILSSCGAAHTTQVDGKTVIITSDTTVVRHSGSLTIKTK